METDRSNQNEEARETSHKDWLSSTGFTLSKLTNLQPPIYNLGNGSQTRSGKLQQGRSSSMSNVLENAGEMSPLVSQRTAWGSNTSIPDLMRQYNVNLPRRPESAKTKSRTVRPPSGRRLRPSSAKDAQRKVDEFAESLVPRPPRIAVKGAKYDPSGRPPKGSQSHHATVGYVGAPNQDLSKEEAGNSLQQFILDHHSANLGKLSAAYAEDGELIKPPPAPTGSPDLERMLNGSASESDLPQEDSAMPDPEPEPPRLPPGPIHFSLPSADHDYKDEDDGDDHDTHGANDFEEATEEHQALGEENSLEKPGVNFAEELNTTIDITPRGLPSRHYKNRSGTPNLKNTISRVDSGFKRPPTPNANAEEASLQNGKLERNIKNRPSSASSNKSVGKSILKSSDVHKKAFVESPTPSDDRHRNLIANKHNKGTKIVPKAVEVSFGDDNEHGSDSDENMGLSKNLIKRKAKVATDKNLETAVAHVDLSDDENSGVKGQRSKHKDSGVKGHRSGEESEGETVQSEMAKFTRIKSSKERNYYELMRKSSGSSLGLKADDKLSGDPVIVKTTKTLEFGSSGLQENKTVSVVDNVPKVAPPLLTRFDHVEHIKRTMKPKSATVTEVHSVNSKNNVQNSHENVDGLKRNSRPKSATNKSGSDLKGSVSGDHLNEMTHSPIRRQALAENKVTNDERPERPGSRIGHHIMPPSGEKPNLPFGDGKLVRPNSTAAVSSRRNLVSGNRQKHVLSGGGLRTKISENVQGGVGNIGTNVESENSDGNGKDSTKEGRVYPGSSDDVKTLVGTQNGMHSDEDGLLRDEQEDVLYQPTLLRCTNMAADEDARMKYINSVKNKARIQSSSLPLKRMMQGIKEKNSENALKVKHHQHDANCETQLSNVIAESLKEKQVKANTIPRKHHRSRSAYVSRNNDGEAEPVVISTTREEVYMDDEQVRDCKNIHFQMLEKGVDVPVETLTRALLPPGEGCIKSVMTQLPRQTSSGLLSHPSVWLSKEFKRLKLAEKAVRMAHERLWEQEQRAKREAGLLKTPVKKKNTKKTIRKRTSTVS